MISQNNQRIAELSSENIGILSADLFPDTSGTLTDEQIQEIKEIADKDVVLFTHSENSYIYIVSFKLKTEEACVFEIIEPIGSSNNGTTLTFIEISVVYSTKSYNLAEKKTYTTDKYVLNINDLITAIKSTKDGETVDLTSYNDLISTNLLFSTHTPILIDGIGNVYDFGRPQSGNYDALSFTMHSSNGNAIFLYTYIAEIQNGLEQSVVHKYIQQLKSNGDGSLFLSDNGEYKEILDNMRTGKAALFIKRDR